MISPFDYDSEVFPTLHRESIRQTNLCLKITFAVELLLLSLVITPSTNSQPSTPWVSAYYMSYSGIHPDDMDFTGISHVFHLGEGLKTGFVNDGPTYWQLTNSLLDSILFFTNDGNFATQNMVQTLVNTVHAAGAKILLSVGTPFGEDRSIIISDSAKLQTAVDHIVAFAQRWGYDGIDLDWESADKTQSQISRLTRMLRRSLDTWTPRGILTVSLGHQDYEYYDPGLQSSIDQYNVFGYDLKQNNDNVTSFNSPLYAPPASLSQSLFNWQDNWYGTWGSTGSTIQNGVRKMMQLGFDELKLGIGIPTYGYLWTNKSAPGQPRAGSIIDAGFMHYYEAINTLSKGGVYHWVDTSKVPWIGGTITTFINLDLPLGRLFYITYDDTNSVKAKVAWAHQYQLGGIMIYDFELGKLPGLPKGSNLPLIKAIVDEVNRLYEDPVPVQLSLFRAISVGLTAHLTWRTETEVDNYGFEIERREMGQREMGQILTDPRRYESENDGANSVNSSPFTLYPSPWITVGFVQGSGTSSSPRDYSFEDKPDQPGRFAYRLKQLDHSGASSYTSALEVDIGLTPLEFSLSHYPDPFNPTTTIEFTLPQDGHATLKVYSILGEEVATLFGEEGKAGMYYQVVFDASHLASGVYLARLEALGRQLLQKMVLLR